MKLSHYANIISPSPEFFMFILSISVHHINQIKGKGPCLGYAFYVGGKSSERISLS